MKKRQKQHQKATKKPSFFIGLFVNSLTPREQISTLGVRVLSVFFGTLGVRLLKTWSEVVTPPRSAKYGR